MQQLLLNTAKVMPHVLNSCKQFTPELKPSESMLPDGCMLFRRGMYWVEGMASPRISRDLLRCSKHCSAGDCRAEW